MNPMGKYLIVTSLGVLLGVAGSVLMDGKALILNAVGTVTGTVDEVAEKKGGGEREPLYWVAPMDPDYKRDKPGKSPMGMDLIPVYEEPDEADSPGTVKISPDVVNNLGVRTEKVEKGTFDTSVRTVGYVQYDEDRLVHIHPRVEGWIEELFIKAEGDRVTQGEPLYSIYSPTLVNAQEELLLALKRDNPSMIKAAMARLRALQVPDAVIESLRQDRLVSQTVTLRAPQNGVLDNLDVREGMFVRPGMSMMTIGVLDRVWVVGEVFERQAAMISEGDEVNMALDYLPNRQWNGSVDYIYPSIDNQTRTARIRMRFDNEDLALMPGMFAQLSIAADPGDSTLQIPREALIRTGSQSRVVAAMGEGKFKSIEVKVGRVGQDKVEILSGLMEGDRIVTSAQFLIDSESSRTSDFRRMEHDDNTSGQDDSRVKSVWTAARIEGVMSGHRMVTLAHDPIEEWEWPAMSMDFLVDDAVDLEPLETGMEVHVEIIQVADSEYRVQTVHVGDQAAEEPTPEQMGHAGHDHSHEADDESTDKLEHSNHSSHSSESAGSNHSSHAAHAKAEEGKDDADGDHHEGMNHEGHGAGESKQ